MDTDRSGQLDHEELFEFFADYADEGIADELIAALDTNGDKTVDFEEFCAGWHRFFAGADTEAASVVKVQAAVRLQAAVRGRRTRVGLNVRLQAATKIQRTTRRFLASRKAKRLVQALLLRQEERDRLTGTPTRTRCCVQLVRADRVNDPRVCRVQRISSSRPDSLACLARVHRKLKNTNNSVCLTALVSTGWCNLKYHGKAEH